MSAHPDVPVARPDADADSLVDHEPGGQPDVAFVAPSKTHFDHLRARRTDAQGEALLAEALARLQARRRSRRGSLIGLPSRAPSFSASPHLGPAG